MVDEFILAEGMIVFEIKFNLLSVKHGFVSIAIKKFDIKFSCVLFVHHVKQ